MYLYSEHIRLVITINIIAVTINSNCLLHWLLPLHTWGAQGRSTNLEKTHVVSKNINEKSTTYIFSLSKMGIFPKMST